MCDDGEVCGGSGRVGFAICGLGLYLDGSGTPPGCELAAAENRDVKRYVCVMIRSFRHKGLRLFYEDENTSKLQSTHLVKIRRILTRLEFAKSVDDIDLPGARLHPLTGQLKGFYALRVSGNWRVIFRFEDGNVYDVDYLDYH